MLHAGAYLFLVLFWKIFFIIKKDNSSSYKSNLLWVGLGCFLFGMLIEVLQGTLTSYRTPDWWDIVANSTGVILAVLIFWFLAPKIESWRKQGI
ncbi:teicoplanin resistance protein VanZ [Gramella sp. AN32]|nr:teicoplanin resistance protein VanZ [Gramella sp. AN32]